MKPMQYVLGSTIAIAFALAGAVGAAADSAAPAGPVTITLTCDTGPAGSGAFSVTANGKVSTIVVKCGKSAGASNPAWLAGSNATIHQTATAAGALRAADRVVTLKAAGTTVAIRNFRPASSATVATLATTGGGGGPATPVAAWLAMLLGGIVLASGARLLAPRR